MDFALDSHVKQLLTTVNDLTQSFNSGEQVDMAVLDFSRAFDEVAHKKLLHKVQHYGITGPLYAWLTSSLTNRSMRVVLAESCCKSTTVDAGVPQGTVLGPLLFLHHITDLTEVVTYQVLLFVDVCLLYREISSFRITTL